MNTINVSSQPNSEKNIDRIIINSKEDCCKYTNDFKNLNFHEIHITTNLNYPFFSKTFPDIEEFPFKITFASNVTSIAALFSHCKKLKKISDLETSNISHFEDAFNGCESLEEIPVLDMSKAEDINGMFWNCKKLESVTFDLSLPLLKSADDMFCNCISLKSAKILNNGISSKSIAGLFTGCANLSKVDISIANCYTVQNLFKNCLSLRTVNIENEGDGVKCANNMFENCSSLVEAPNLDTSNFESMDKMFLGCSNLKKIPTLDLKECRSMADTFVNCSSLEDVSFINIHQDLVLNKLYTFHGCPLADKLDLPEVYDTDQVLRNENLYTDFMELVLANSINKLLIKQYGYYIFSAKSEDRTDKWYRSVKSLLLKIKEINFNIDFKYYPCSYIMEFFYGLNITKVANITNTDKIKDFSYMFAGCKHLTSISEFSMKSANNVSHMFENCSSLQKIVFKDKINAVCNNMFSKCISLQYADLSNIKAVESNVNNNTFSASFSLFEDCINLEECKLPDVSELRNLSCCFKNCSKLTKVSDIYADKVMSHSEMFVNCDELTVAPAMNINSDSEIRNMYSNCKNLEDISKVSFSTILNSYFSDEIFANCPKISKYPFKNTCYISEPINRNKKQSDLLIKSLRQGLIENVVIGYDINKETDSPFRELKHLAKLKFNIEIAPHVKKINYLFEGFTYLEEAPHLNTENIIEAQGLFEKCTSLKTVPNYNFSNLTNGFNLFYKCPSIDIIPSINFNDAFLKKLGKCSTSYLGLRNFIYEDFSLRKPANLKPKKKYVASDAIKNIAESVELDSTKNAILVFDNIECFRVKDPFLQKLEKELIEANKVETLKYIQILENHPETVKLVVITFNTTRDKNGKYNSPLAGLQKLKTVTFGVKFARCVTNADYLFAESSIEKIEGDIQLSFINSLEGMFYKCSNLKDMPDLNLEKIKNISYMFKDCINLEKINFNGDFLTKAGIKFRGFADNCPKLQNKEYDFFDGVWDF